MRIIRSVPLSNAARFLAYSSNLRKVVGVPLWLRGVGKMLGSAEVHPIKRIPSFNPESVKILPLLFFFPLSLSPFVLQIIGGRWWSLFSVRERGMFAAPLRQGPWNRVQFIRLDAVIKEWRKQLELVFCVDPPRFGGVQGGVVAL